MKILLFIFLSLSLYNFINYQRNEKFIIKYKWVQNLIDLAKRDIKYINIFPYNQLFFDGKVW